MNREVHMERGIDRSAVARRRGRPGQGIGGPAVAPHRGRPAAPRIESQARGAPESRDETRRPYNAGGHPRAAVGQGPPIISDDRQLQKGWEPGDGREAPRHGAGCLDHNGQSRTPSGVAAPPQRRRAFPLRNWRTLLWPGRRGCRSISPQGASGGVSLSGSQPRRAPLQTAFNGGRKPLLMPFKWPGATLHIQAARPAVYSAKCAA